MDGLERRRRSIADLEERLARFNEASGRKLRKFVWMAIGLGAAISVIVNVIFHLLAK